MYINPYERFKNIRNEDLKTKDESNEAYDIDAKNNHEIQDNKNLDREQLVKELYQLFKNQDIHDQYYLVINNDKKNLNNQNLIFYDIPTVEIDVLKLNLYSSPLLFLMKKIVKGLPRVKPDDKRVLWDRVKLFSRVLNDSLIKNEERDPNATIIEDELDFDDPIDYITNEFRDVIRAYGIRERIVLYFKNIDNIPYNKFKEIVTLMRGIFNNISNFKIVVEIDYEVIRNHYMANYKNEIVSKNILDYELELYDQKYEIKTSSFK